MRSTSSAEGLPGSAAGRTRTGGMRIRSLRLQPGRRIRPLAVHPHLALADHAVDAAARHVPEALVHEVVEALSGLVLGDLEVLDGGAGFGGFDHEISAAVA